MQIITITKGIILIAHMMIQVSAILPVCVKRKYENEKAKRPPKLQLITGKVPKYGAISFEVISLMKEGMTATYVPIVHPMKNRKIIRIIIQVYMRKHTVREQDLPTYGFIYLTLYYFIKQLEITVPTRAPKGMIEDRKAFVVTIFPLQLNVVMNRSEVYVLATADTRARLNAKQNMQEQTIITALVCLHVFKLISSLPLVSAVKVFGLVFQTSNGSSFAFKSLSSIINLIIFYYLFILLLIYEIIDNNINPLSK